MTTPARKQKTADEIAALEATHQVLLETSETLKRDRAERKRSDMITKVATIVAAILLVVDLCALGFIVKVQADNHANLSKITQIVKNSKSTDDILVCAVKTNDPNRTDAENKEAFKVCIKERQK